ncbi:alpha/beta hydrolase family protein [Roseateles sp.]|uniref:alpha/beta hydrolase family protein n=1 Tax=Roseateles sp. TaxID=1971397 RepID=UPI003BA640CE
MSRNASLSSSPLLSRPLLVAATALLCACGGGSDEPKKAADKPRTLLSHSAYAKAQSFTGLQQAQLLRYRMPALNGGQTETEALLFLPSARPAAGDVPLVVWTHGTVGVADACAPSRNADTHIDKPEIQALLNAGFAVLAPDYEGLGGPGAHPYLHVGSLGQSVTAAVEAAHQLPGLRLSKPWALIGHSQGGYAALAGAEMSARMDAAYPLRATVALAPASDPARMAAELFQRIDDLQSSFSEQPSEQLADALVGTVYQLAANGTMLSLGLLAQDPSLKVEQLMEASFLPIAKLAADDTVCQAFEDAIEQDLKRHVSSGQTLSAYPSVKRSAFLSESMSKALSKNRPGQVKLQSPVLVVQGVLDDQTPIKAARELVAEMQRVGSSVRYIEVPDGSHGSITQSHMPEAIAFIRERLKP